MSQTDPSFDPGLAELQERARTFVDEWLIPHEELAERSGGRLPEDIRAGLVAASMAARLNGGRHARKYGGQEWSATEWFLVQEQYGRSRSSAIWYRAWTAG
jgi:acyl-CoA dehydrogenase